MEAVYEGFSMKRDTKELFRIVVLISGRGSNLEALLKRIDDGSVPAEVVLVVSDKASAHGLTIASKYKIPTVVIARKNDGQKQGKNLTAFHEELLAAVSSARPQLVVLAGYMRILPPAFITAFKNKIINIHPSLLPAFRGLNAQQQALDAGVKVAGCSVHYVVNDVDAGPIVAQAVVPVFPEDTVEELSLRILNAEHELLPACIGAMARDEISLVVKNGKEVVQCKNSQLLQEKSLAFFTLQTKTI